jgi:signal transduction histidine kinase
LDVTRIENHSLSLHKENFNLNEMIQNTISDFINQIRKTKQQQQQQQLHPQHQGTLKIESLFKEEVFIYADRSRLNQVISNLLDNAIKFTNEDKADGTITIMVEKKDSNYVVVSIKDTGKGIDSEILPRLFTKFVTKSGNGGTGLGLFISKSIIDAHDGKIWAENNSNGRGSAFYFRLPL